MLITSKIKQNYKSFKNKKLIFKIKWALLLIIIMLLLFTIISTVDQNNKEILPILSSNIDDKTILPKKGSIIVLQKDKNTYYRVLDIDKTEALLLRMTPLTKIQFNKTSCIGTNENDRYQQYINSDIDIYLNTEFYNSLPKEIKDSIVKKYIVQNNFEFTKEYSEHNVKIYHYNDFSDISSSDSKRYIKHISSEYVGERFIYLLDVDDIYNYFEKNEITSKELIHLFFNTYEKVDEGIWTRSGRSNKDNYVITIGGLAGDFIYNFYNGMEQVKPVFTIDLEKVNYVEYDLEQSNIKFY